MDGGFCIGFQHVLKVYLVDMMRGVFWWMSKLVVEVLMAFLLDFFVVFNGFCCEYVSFFELFSLIVPLF